MAVTERVGGVDGGGEEEGGNDREKYKLFKSKGRGAKILQKYWMSASK